MASLVDEEGPAFYVVSGLGVLVYKEEVGRGIERGLAHPFVFPSPLCVSYHSAAPVCHNSLPTGSKIDVTIILIYRNLQRVSKSMCRFSIGSIFAKHFF